MAIITKYIDGRKVEFTNLFRPTVSEYGVYKNKIWRAVASEGAGFHYKLTLEREKTNERITLQKDELKECYKLFKPSGYIPV
jgi:hypothetical protein